MSEQDKAPDVEAPSAPVPDQEPAAAPEQAPEEPKAPEPVQAQAPALPPTIIVQSTTEDEAKRKEAYSQACVAELDRIAKAGKRYFIVNPGGFIHEVLRPHALALLKGEQGLGFRMAKDHEVAKLNAAQGFQKVGEPLVAPFEPEKDVELSV
jgi:hypothetical protein